MKITVAASAPRPAYGRLLNHIRDVVSSAATTDRLARELEDELRAISASGRSAEPEARRDALERAVLRVWGTAL